MKPGRRAPLLIAALLIGQGAAAQVRTAPVVAPVPVGAVGVAGAAGVAATLKTSALPAASALALPGSVLPSPASALAPMARAAETEAALRASLNAPAAALAAPAAAAANEAKPSRRDERRQALLDGMQGSDAPRRAELEALRDATEWIPVRPGDAPASLARRAERPVDAAQFGARLNQMFDGAAPKPTAGTVSLETLEAAPAVQGGPAGPALLAEVRARARQGQRGQSYDAAKSYLFTDADSVVENGVRGVRDAYSGVFVPGRSGNGGDYAERGDQDGDGYNERHGMNVEHLWPQSYFSERLPMRSDLHHLMATFQHPNGMRGRLPFGEVPDGAVEYHNRAGARMGAGLFEPPDSAKGRVARAMLYFMARYGSEGVLPGNVVNHFWNARIETFLRWNRQFPPDAFERDRNGRVERFQGNRNPFVDDPSLADRIGVEGFRMQGGKGFTARAETGSGAQVSGRPAKKSSYRGGKQGRDRGSRRNHRRNRW